MLSKGKALLTLNPVYNNEDKNGHPTEKSDPNPVQFEKFIPWVCSQWCASTMAQVTKEIQDDYVSQRVTSRSRNSKTNRRLIRRKNVHVEDTGTLSSEEAVKFSESVVLTTTVVGKVVPIKALYNKREQLVEISIVGCPFLISRKIIHAISLCIPFHGSLTRLTIRKGGLSSVLIYDINKLLFISNITEIIFDDSYIKEGNYYILLEQPHLKYLSLNRCRINDEICSKIAINIDYDSSAAISLQILELGSNEITDFGAQMLALSLKRNRCLLHLNLSGNRITDDGFKVIMNILKPFPLSDEENADMKLKKLRYLQNRHAVYVRCLNDLRAKYDESQSTLSSGTSSKKTLVTTKRKRKVVKKFVGEVALKSQAETMAKGIVGDLNDPYSSANIVVRDGVNYCKGNMTLCSLNMAYNQLDYHSIGRVLEVLVHQSELRMGGRETGLMRITLDGNYLPESCAELDDIDEYLKDVIPTIVPTSRKNRMSSQLLKKLLANHCSFINS